MAFEHFRTQVLLLHSQQGTLDSLSAGFNDNYSVHCATIGSEALNIFGETPIHVIVSAQHLPGMSGLEALREAKKRSPDTIGILLANLGYQVAGVTGRPEAADYLTSLGAATIVARDELNEPSKRPLESEGVPPLIENPEEALAVFEEILKRGAIFYPEAHDTSQGHQRVHRIVPLSES